MIYLLDIYKNNHKMITQFLNFIKENESSTDCRSEDGITVSLIDSIISICRVLKTRDLTSGDAQEALKDLSDDEDLKYILSQQNLK